MNETQTPKMGGRLPTVLHVDINLLIDAFKVFRGDSSSTSTELISALDFANALIVYDYLAYDESVQRKQLQALKDAMEDIQGAIVQEPLVGELVRRIRPACPYNETPLTSRALANSVNWLQEVAATGDESALVPLVPEFSANISVPAREHLFGYLERNAEPSQDELQSLLSDRSILGGRFFHAIWSEAAILDLIRREHREGILNPENIKYLFSRFRMEFGAVRAAEIDATLTDRSDGKCFYFPTVYRRKILRHLGKRVFDASRMGGKADEILKNIAYRFDVDHLSTCVRRRRTLPYALHAALVWDNDWREGDRVRFLEACLRANWEQPTRLQESREIASAYEDSEREDIFFEYVAQLADRSPAEIQGWEFLQAIFPVLVCGAYRFGQPEDDEMHEWLRNVKTAYKVLKTGHDLVMVIAEHIAKHESRWMKEAIMVAEMLPLIALRPQDYEALRRIFGNGLGDLVGHALLQ